MGNKISSLPVCVKVRKTKDSLKKRVTSSPTYKKFLKKRDKLANRIRDGILAFFSIFGPCWTFLFVKTSDSDETSEVDNEISKKVIPICDKSKKTVRDFVVGQLQSQKLEFYSSTEHRLLSRSTVSSEKSYENHSKSI